MSELYNSEKKSENPILNTFSYDDIPEETKIRIDDYIFTEIKKFSEYYEQKIQLLHNKIQNLYNKETHCMKLISFLDRLSTTIKDSSDSFQKFEDAQKEYSSATIDKSILNQEVIDSINHKFLKAHEEILTAGNPIEDTALEEIELMKKEVSTTESQKNEIDNVFSDEIKKGINDKNPFTALEAISKARSNIVTKIIETQDGMELTNFDAKAYEEKLTEINGVLSRLTTNSFKKGIPKKLEPFEQDIADKQLAVIKSDIGINTISPIIH